MAIAAAVVHWQSLEVGSSSVRFRANNMMHGMYLVVAVLMINRDATYSTGFLLCLLCLLRLLFVLLDFVETLPVRLFH